MNQDSNWFEPWSRQNCSTWSNSGENSAIYLPRKILIFHSLFHFPCNIANTTKHAALIAKTVPRGTLIRRSALIKGIASNSESCLVWVRAGYSTAVQLLSCSTWNKQLQVLDG